MKQEKRGFCPCDDKRYLLADLRDGCYNPNTYAYGHGDLAAEEHLVAHHPELGAELIIRHPEERFARRHARVTRRLDLAGVMDMEGKLYDDDADCELHVGQLLVAEQVAAARPGGAMRMNKKIERIITRDNLERPISPPTRMPDQPTSQRAGPSGLNAHLPPFRRRIDSSDEDELVRPVWPFSRAHLKLEDGDYKQERAAEPKPPRCRKKARRRTNPFIDAIAGVDDDASGDEETEDKNDDFDDNIVADEVKCIIINYCFSIYFIVSCNYLCHHRLIYITHALIFCICTIY